jgi:hypothetical protein
MGNAYEGDLGDLKPVFSLKWAVLDRPQRISTLLGLIGGGFGAVFGIFVSAAFNPLSFVVFLPLLVPLLGSLSLLYVPMSDERRGVTGFLTLLASLAPLSFLILFLLRLVFPYRDTPTGL